MLEPAERTEFTRELVDHPVYSEELANIQQFRNWIQYFKSSPESATNSLSRLPFVKLEQLENVKMLYLMPHNTEPLPLANLQAGHPPQRRPITMEEVQAITKVMDCKCDSPRDAKQRKAEKMLMAQGEGLESGDPPLEWVQEAKNLFPKPASVRCPYCMKPITPFKKPLKTQNLINFLWLVLAAAAFAGSFVYRRYFFQCLALALFFGIKWVIDIKLTRTQILIYKALKDEDPGVHSRDLHKSSTHL